MRFSLQNPPSRVKIYPVQIQMVPVQRHERGRNMGKTPKYYLVDASALPEVFLKVAEAKRLLETGEAGTVNDAAKITGISRSAFYKYRDAVFPFQDMTVGRIVTFQLMLKDKTGVLSEVLLVFAETGANILTINQSIPSNGCALVTISAETSELRGSLEELIKRAENTDGVLKVEILAG